MSMDAKELIELRDRLKRVDTAEIMDKIVVGEGINARDNARKICKEEKIVNTGDYRRSFKSGTVAIREGDRYKIDVYNNVDYAKHLEYGFRSHFVPGHWEGHTFVYEKGSKQGMYVGPRGGYVPGHYTLRRALQETKRTQDARIERKLEKYLAEVMK